MDGFVTKSRKSSVQGKKNQKIKGGGEGNGKDKKKEKTDEDVEIIAHLRGTPKNPPDSSRKRKHANACGRDDSVASAEQPGPSHSVAAASPNSKTAQKPTKQEAVGNWKAFFDAAKAQKQNKAEPKKKKISVDEIEEKSPAQEHSNPFNVKNEDLNTRRETVLKEVFKHADYKSKLQREAIEYILQRKGDAFVSFPTGAGKSLCYQLPTVVHAGLAIVISPLLALIKDQVNALKAKRIPCETLNSSIPETEKKRIRTELAKDKPEIKFLYITAEGVATDNMQRILTALSKRNQVSYIVIDEAHCVTQWGHDFRPDYLNLRNIKNFCPGVPLIALTATANAHSQSDILSQLEMAKAKIFRASTYRENLFYDVHIKDQLACAPENHMVDFIKRCLRISDAATKTEAGKKAIGSGIVYCRSRLDCEHMVRMMELAGLEAMPYHAGLPDKVRNEVQQKWMSGAVPVVAATIAFGMGIDKPDVRVVVHWSPSNSLAAYYQEAGRAGRDGSRSYCRIYYSNSERQSLEYCLRTDIVRIKNKKISDDAKEIQIKAHQHGFEKIVEYCETAQCRHRLMASFFNESDLQDCTKNCDFCRTPSKVRQVSSALIMQREANIFNRGRVRAESSAAESFGYEPRQKNDKEEYSGFENGREMMEKAEAERLRTIVQDEFGRRRKARELASGGVMRKQRPRGDVLVLDKDSRRVESLTIVRRESIVRSLLQVLDDNNDCHTMNQQRAAQLELDACYSQAKTLSSYDHKAALLVNSIKSATKRGEQFEVGNCNSGSCVPSVPPTHSLSTPAPASASLPSGNGFMTARALL